MTTEEYFGDWLDIIPKSNILTYTKMLMQAQLNGIPIEPKDGFGVFKAFNRTPLESCKAVILGQDPYFDGSATGLAFANDVERKDFSKVSPSLSVIKNSVISLAKSEDLINFDFSLESWAAQGILLLNSALTVRRGVPGSHTEAWKPFIKLVAKNLSTYKPRIFWILFGKQAWDFKEYINPKSPILMEYHPAFYARNNKEMSPNVWEKLIDYYQQEYNQDLLLYE